MSEPYLAQICIVSFNFPPRGFAQCDGQILPITQNQSLFSLLGTTYGGDGRTSFALPDLRGRTPIHVGGGFTQGQKGGTENHALSVAEMPAHRHAVWGKDAADEAEPADNMVMGRGEVNVYRPPGTNVAMRPGIVANAGSNAGHNNMQPYLALNYLIAIQGIFPPRN